MLREELRIKNSEFRGRRLEVLFAGAAIGRPLFVRKKSPVEINGGVVGFGAVGGCGSPKSGVIGVPRRELVERWGFP